MRPAFDYSLHDAWIETVTIGPRREISLELALASARISDERLPHEATLRIGDIGNFQQVRDFFVRVGLAPIARIDGIKVMATAGSACTVIMEFDPHGVVKLVCNRLELSPIDII